MNEKQTTMVRPTKKQKELLEFIESFVAEHGYSPSYREIMAGLNYTSVATVALHVNSLIKRGHLTRRDRSARSLEVVNNGGPAGASIKTNEVRPADEKWLVDKVGHLFSEAEMYAAPIVSSVKDLEVLLAALRVLGLEAAAQSFVPRLSALKSRAGTPEP